MIDLHAHLLPGLDDGPATLDDSLALLRRMEAQGVQTVVAAVHALDGRYNPTRDDVLRSLDQVRSALAQAGSTLRVLASMELYLGYDILAAVKSGKVLGIHDSPYLVVELPHREFPAYTERALFELMIAGYRPILNHPERNAEIRRRPQLLERLADKGVLAMITASSLIGRFGPDVQQVAEAFVQDELATLIVSDAHDLSGRAPHLPEGLAAARRLGKIDQSDEAAILG